MTILRRWSEKDNAHMTTREVVDFDGFAIVPEALASKDIDEILRSLESAPARRSRAGMRHCLDSAEVARLSRDSTLLTVAREVLGDDAFPFRATLFDKSPSANWLVVWHQDTALPIQERHDVSGWGPWSIKEGILHAHAPAEALSEVLALRVHLDNSTLENGPLRVLPRTHGLGVLSDDAMHRLATEVTPMDCLVPRGGVLAMRPLLVHSSSKSKVGNPRRVLHIEYVASALLPGGLRLAVAGNQQSVGAVK